MDLEILILIFILGVISLLSLIFLFIALSKNKKTLLEMERLEELILKHSESNRVIDSIESFLSNNSDPDTKLCESLRIITNANSVIYTEMNKTDGSFKPKAKSSLNDINIEKFETEYVDDSTLAIITGSEGTSKIFDKEEKNIFPNWFKEIDYKTVISVPLINGFETLGCLYIFLNKELEKNIDEFLKNIWIMTNLYIKNQIFTPTNNFNQKEFNETSVTSLNEENKQFFTLDENLELLKFKDKEISLSNSEYLIMKRLVDKKGDVLLYEEIENVLWPNNLEINKSAMRLHIHRLREKSNNVSGNLDLIKTVRAKGIYLELKSS